MATSAQLKAMRKKYHLGEFSKARKSKPKKPSKAGRKTKHRRGGNMAKGFSVGGLTSTKNLVGTLAGAFIAPKVGISPSIGAAAGSFLYGKQGIAGAAVGYFAAPYIASMLGGLGTNANGDAWY